MTASRSCLSNPTLSTLAPSSRKNEMQGAIFCAPMRKKLRPYV